jgi:hypothetical protein
VETALRVAKFAIGAAILVFAILDVDPQPFTVILALVLMGVIAADELFDWLPSRPSRGVVDPDHEDHQQGEADQ